MATRVVAAVSVAVAVAVAFTSGTGCGDRSTIGTATDSDTWRGTIRTEAALSADARTCLPGRFVGELANPNSDCPAPAPGWRSFKHRTATAAGVGTDTTVLKVATCSYVWQGESSPSPSTTTPPPPPNGPLDGSDESWLRPLCVAEPAPPTRLFERSCPAGIQIGLRPVGLSACPAAPGWRVSPLFPEKSGELARYCRYIAVTDAATTPAPPGGNGNGNGNGNAGNDDASSEVERIPFVAHTQALPPWVRKDCAVVGGLALTAPESRRAEMEQAYADAAEALSQLPLLGGGGQPTRVRVAVIDSALDGNADDGLPGVGQASHGRAMGTLIARMACPERANPLVSACAVDVRTHPALWLERREDGYARVPNGGFFGLQSDAARAIVDAVDSAPPDGPTILNLSLGWASAFGGDEAAPAAFSPQVRAVYSAIEYAVCNRALVIVAGGNASGHPATPLGPLLPGGWETRPAPTVARCHALGVANSRLGPAGGPLLRAAGGVDGQDRRLFNTPLLGLPQIAAPASNAIVPDPAPSLAQTAGGRTGSSVAAALTSAAAAIVWSHRPDLPPDAVANAVYDSGVNLGAAADFCFAGGGGAVPAGGACPQVHRVSICRATRAACALAPSGCDRTVTCQTAGARTSPNDQPDYAAMHASSAANSRPGAPPVRNAWQLPILQTQPNDPGCSFCDVSLDNWWLDLNSNPILNSYAFRAQSILLPDVLGSLRIELPADPSFAFLGGVDTAGAVDLSLAEDPIPSGELDLSYTPWDDPWATPVWQTEWLYITP